MILRIRPFLMKGQHIYLPTTNHMEAQNPEFRRSFPNLSVYCFVFLLGSAVSFLRGGVTEKIKYNTDMFDIQSIPLIVARAIYRHPSRGLVTPKGISVIVRESYPKWPTHSGEGCLINCQAVKDYFNLYESPSGVSPTYQ